jgi:hypothetical protein
MLDRAAEVDKLRETILRVLYRRADDNAFSGLYSLAKEIAVELKDQSLILSLDGAQVAVQSPSK